MPFCPILVLAHAIWLDLGPTGEASGEPFGPFGQPQTREKILHERWKALLDALQVRGFRKIPKIDQDSHIITIIIVIKG